MFNQIYRNLIFFLLAICPGVATEYQPWLGNFYEFELRSSLLYQKYHWISSESHLKKHFSNDFFLNASLSNAIPDPDIGGELELTQAGTRQQKGDLDQIKLTGRYLWLDDVAGDTLSLTIGFSYAQAFKHSLRDVSSFHHGFNNAEFFVSIGRENPEESVWGSRWWSMFAIGMAERGSPWLRLHVEYDKRWWDRLEMTVFLHSLWGLGRQKLHPHHFHGYGSIAHQSVDVGLRSTYLLEFGSNVSLEYAYRVYASNFPAYVHQVLVQMLYTFGL